jgi:Uma2 family endonuclease
MTVSTTKMNADQFFLLGRDPPGVRLELVDGEIIVSPSPNPRHARTVAQLLAMLVIHVEHAGLGEVLADVDTIFGEYDVRRPDVLFFTASRQALIGEKRLTGKPDLAVEVVSPTSDRADKIEKFKQYAKGGVKYYWIIDPGEKTFEAYTLKSGHYQLSTKGEREDIIHAEPFKDLAIPLKKLWWRK